MPVRQPHTVPAAYLTRFARREGKKKKWRMHALDLERGTWSPTTPAKACRMRDAYRVEVPPGEEEADPDLVERDYFGRLESDLTPILRELDRVVARDREARSLTPVEYARLIEFVSAQFVRTTSRRSSMDLRADVLARTVLDEASADPAAWDALRARAARDGLDVSTLTVEVVRETVRGDVMTFGLAQNAYVRVLLDGIQEVATALAGKSWRLLVAESPDSQFITSDDPVAIFQFGRSTEEVHARLDLRHDPTGCALALSPQLLLVGGKGIPPGIEEVDRREVAIWNTSLAMPGRRWIYAARPDFEWLDLTSKTIRRAHELAARVRVANASIEGLRRARDEEVRTKFAEQVRGGCPGGC